MGFRELYTRVPNFLPVTFNMPNFPLSSGARCSYIWDAELARIHISQPFLTGSPTEMRRNVRSTASESPNKDFFGSFEITTSFKKQTIQ